MKSSLSRRKFLKSIGLTGAAIGGAALLETGGGGSVLGNNKSYAATEANYISPYESVMQDRGRIYGRAAKCPGPSGPIAFENREISGISKIESYDVVVVGAGVAGMTAALKAADSGLTVCVLEKMSAGRGIFECFLAMGSKLQKDNNVNITDADKVDLITRLYNAADWRLRRGPVHTFVERCAEAADFVDEKLREGPNGMYCTIKDSDAYWECGFKTPEGTGDVVGRHGLYVVRELATVGKTRYSQLFTLKLNTPGVQLIRDGNGPVTGVIAKDADGYLRVNAAKGVILATGGYDANPAMMEAYCRSEDYANLIWWNGSFGTTGDGHMMGLKAGAIMDSAPHAIMSFDGRTSKGKFIRNGANNVSLDSNTTISVNAAGKRFMSEGRHAIGRWDMNHQKPDSSAGYWGGGEWSYAVNAAAAQEKYGAETWQIGVKVSYPRNPVRPLEDLKNEYKADGLLHEAGSLRELAEKCGINPDGLEKTVSDWNSYCDQGLDKEFGRLNAPGKNVELSPISAANKIEGSTYYALKMPNGYMLATVSGLQVDQNFNVLGADEKPIEKLYAAGNASGCFFYGYYPRSIAGASVGRAMTSGYVAAKHIFDGIDNG